MNLFIAGMEKSGTTALAGWLVENNLAEYLVPNTKEPFIYAHSHPCNHAGTGNKAILDASPGYALNPSAIEKFPPHDTKILICLRNPFERTWSSYKMRKICIRDGDDALSLWEEFLDDKSRQERPVEYLRRITKLHFPRKSNSFIDRYFDIEIDNLTHQTFEERTMYEISFLLRRRQFPFLSILEHSFYTFPLKNLLARFTNEDIFLLSLRKISSDEGLRNKLFNHIFSLKRTHPPIEEKFSSGRFSLEEKSPDFKDGRWDFLRNFFRDDIRALESILKDNSLSDEYLDKDELSKYIGR